MEANNNNSGDDQAKVPSDGLITVDLKVKMPKWAKIFETSTPLSINSVSDLFTYFDEEIGAGVFYTGYHDLKIEEGTIKSYFTEIDEYGKFREAGMLLCKDGELRMIDSDAIPVSDKTQSILLEHLHDAIYADIGSSEDLKKYVSDHGAVWGTYKEMTTKTTKKN